MNFPIMLYASGLLLIGLMAESLAKIKQPWAIASLMVYLTTMVWYFVDPFQFPEAYKQFPDEILSTAYLQVALFLGVFRWATPQLALQTLKNVNLVQLKAKAPDPEQVFFLLLGLWFPLLIVGIWRCDWNIMAALLPLDGRAASMQMWGRGALGGTFDSLVSAGGYSFLIVCSLMGGTLVLQRRFGIRLINGLIFFVSIPSFLLTGNRSTFLAMVLPFFITYLIAGRQQLFLRIGLILLCGVGMHFLLLGVMENRSTGYRFLFEEDAAGEKAVLESQLVGNGGLSAVKEDKQTRQVGLNMIQELCYINEFAQTGTFSPSYGLRYLTEITNVIPRALWPGKPMLGIDYAIWRGFGNNAGGIGVNATIATGMIGGGLLNFGPWLGPIAPALLIALWAALLTRWWVERVSILRLSLFTAGLGLTFNLGRDITLLVLWPIVFGYVVVRLAEMLSKGSKKVLLPGNISRWKTTNPALRQS